MELVLEWKHGVVGQVGLWLLLEAEEELLIQDHSATHPRTHARRDPGVDQMNAAESSGQRTDHGPALGSREAIKHIQERPQALLAPVNRGTLVVLQHTELHVLLSVDQEQGRQQREGGTVSQQAQAQGQVVRD